MRRIQDQLDQAFRQAIREAVGFDAEPLITPAQNERFGDYQSNAAMGLAKEVATRRGEKANPRQIAEQIKAKLELGPMASEVSIAGPGFINVRLSPDWLAGQMAAIAQDPRLGLERVERPERVVVDYSGPNIAKEMHVGHLRSTVIGDSVARTLQFLGHSVIRQNHVGDWGTQFGRVVLALWYLEVSKRPIGAPLSELMHQMSTMAHGDEHARGRLLDELAKIHQSAISQDEAGEKYFEPFLSAYVPDLAELEQWYRFVNSVVDTAAAERIVIHHPSHGDVTLSGLPRLVTEFVQNQQNYENRQEQLAWKKAREVTLSACEALYRRLGVQLADPSVQDERLVRGESEYRDDLPNVVMELRDSGVAEESQGAVVVFVSGAKVPLIIQKKPERSERGQAGGYLYGTTDLAAIRYRISVLKATRIIYFTDARQTQHFALLFAAARKAGWVPTEVSLEHAPFGTVLGEDGKPLKTRTGENVRLLDLIDEAEQRAYGLVSEKSPDLPEAQRRAIAHAVGVGAVKYADLSKDRTSDYVFSWDKMLAMDGNTGPYLQYAYARIRSIFRKAESSGGGSGFGVQGSVVRLESPHELGLLKHILRLGEVIELVQRELRPHYLCNYLYELATRFSGFYENCPVIQSEEPTRSSRLMLCDLTARTMALGLELLGIKHPEQM